MSLSAYVLIHGCPHQLIGLAAPFWRIRSYARICSDGRLVSFFQRKPRDMETTETWSPLGMQCRTWSLLWVPG